MKSSNKILFCFALLISLSLSHSIRLILSVNIFVCVMIMWCECGSFSSLLHSGVSNSREWQVSQHFYDFNIHWEIRECSPYTGNEIIFRNNHYEFTFLTKKKKRAALRHDNGMNMKMGFHTKCYSNTIIVEIFNEDLFVHRWWKGNKQKREREKRFMIQFSPPKCVFSRKVKLVEILKILMNM